MTRLAQCDLCIMSPERCHFEAGTCREPEWGQKFCMTDHVVYLANSSGIKVGITRATQLPTRWLDQGASQALPIMRVATRQQSGFVEDLFRSQVADKTNWRALLKGDAAAVDLAQVRDQLFESCAEGLQGLQQRFGLQAIQTIADVEPLEIRYPVEQYPAKIVSFNLDKNPIAEGTLLGIKGQYLIFDTGVINVRKYRPINSPCINKDSSMRTEQPKMIYLKDYQAPEYLIDETHLTFELFEDHSLVHAQLVMRRNPERGPGLPPLVLDGQQLELLSVTLADQELGAGDYQLTENTLTLQPASASFTVDTSVRIHPETNTALEGLYKSGTMFCTQCEAEGFRKITYYLDRPDVMSKFTTTVVAEQHSYPVLLSNGNPIASGPGEDGRHWATWKTRS